MGTTRVLELVDELAALGVLEVAVAGGEPFLHPDWELVLRRVVARGMNLIVTTNGLLLDAHALAVLQEIQPLEVRVSFDGGPRLHEHVRGRHTYRRSMRTIARMAAAGLRVTGRLTLCAGGDDELNVLFEDLAAAGVRTVKVAVAKAAGRGATPTGRHLVRPVPDPDAADLLRRLAAEAGLTLRLAADDFPTALDDGVLSKLRDVDRPSCGAGTETAYVTPRGELLGCVAIPDRSFGALHTSSFAEVWEGRAAQGYRQEADESGARRLCDVMAARTTPDGAIMVDMPRRRPDLPR
jgi:MoaA/NifB/PqqE/SkfB family radical SAM enzyme